MIEIIVVKFRAPDYEQRCLASITAAGGDYHLTVHDNYPENVVLGKLWNRLIAESPCEYICLLNSDTEVEPGWLDGLLQGFAFDPRVRVVGPSTSACHTVQQQGRAEGYQLVEDLGGFCELFPRSHWEDMGGFDEGYGFYGQESEFHRRTRQAGYRLCWVRDVFVWHAGSASAKLAEQRGEMNIAEERRKGAARYWGKA